MDIGKLNRKVEILTFVWERDDFGGQEGTWVTTDVRWEIGKSTRLNSSHTS